MLRDLHSVLKPKYKILGADFAGINEEVGTMYPFKVGDRVFGDRLSRRLC
jgi:NADPH:quinone reductase-like Zn-dependent oxidoreductase